MSRRRCIRFIGQEPVCRKFWPDTDRATEAVKLHFEELEALRLKDEQEMEQAGCAEYMGISRTTFQRILQSARKKVAVALLQGRAIHIEGGNYIMANRVFECQECSHQWEEVPCSEGGKHGYEIACPQCGGMKKVKLEDGVRHNCGGGDHQQGGGCCSSQHD